MSMRDLLNDIHVLPALTPAAAITSNTTVTGLTIDRLGFSGLTFSLIAGEIASSGAGVAVAVYHGDQADMSDESLAASTDVLGQSFSGFAGTTNQNKTRKIGYIGNKRYVRLKVTTTGNSGNIFLAAIAVLGHAAQTPTVNPPM